MSDTDPAPAAPPPSPEDAARARKLRNKRISGFIAVAVFVAGGFFLFGGKVPREVQLRFDLPPIARASDVAIPRARIAVISAAIATADGAQVASVSLPEPRGLDGPRTAAVVVNLPSGHYAVHARVRSVDGLEAALEGSFDAANGEVVVDLH